MRDVGYIFGIIYIDFKREWCDNNDPFGEKLIRNNFNILRNSFGEIKVSGVEGYEIVPQFAFCDTFATIMFNK